MNSQKNLRDAILSLLPPTLADDLRASVDSAIQHQFERMNLVSREEFEIQRKVLAKTRTRLEALEKIVTELETQQE